jgi:hypothetical protein
MKTEKIIAKAVMLVIVICCFMLVKIDKANRLATHYQKQGYPENKAWVIAYVEAGFSKPDSLYYAAKLREDKNEN